MLLVIDGGGGAELLTNRPYKDVYLAANFNNAVSRYFCIT